MRKCKKYLPYILLCIICIIPAALYKSSYLILLLCMIGIYTIAVSGLDILFGYSGQLSLGHAAFYAIGAYTSTICSKSLGMPVWITMIAGAILATIIAILIALPSVKLVGHFLALVTIAFGQLAYLFVANADQITQGHSGINFIPAPRIGSFVFDTNISYFYIIFILAVIFIII